MVVLGLVFISAIPKHSFILWLAIKSSLTTGDRLLKWGAKREVKCLLCRGCIECTEPFIFCCCGFSKRIWKAIMKKCNLDNIPFEWKDIIEKGVKEWRGKSLNVVICRLA